MRWLITDSGLGGLSVCAETERLVKQIKGIGSFEIIYVNAAPAVDYGYNAMPDRTRKIETFDRFLHNVTTDYSPDGITIACNTLSVLYEETTFAHTTLIPVQGIVEFGLQLSIERLKNHPDTGLIIYATETTTEEGTYPDALEEAGISREQIISQACPGLANAISSDATGRKAARLIQQFSREALKKFSHLPEQISVLLGCTHYGYQTSIFRSMLKALGYSATMLNPNLLAAEHIRDQLITDDGNIHSDTQLSVEFITPYAIPRSELGALSHYLGDSAPETLQAFVNYHQVSNLFT